MLLQFFNIQITKHVCLQPKAIQAVVRKPYQGEFIV